MRIWGRVKNSQQPTIEAKRIDTPLMFNKLLISDELKEFLNLCICNRISIQCGSRFPHNSIRPAGPSDARMCLYAPGTIDKVPGWSRRAQPLLGARKSFAHRRQTSLSYRAAPLWWPTPVRANSAWALPPSRPCRPLPALRDLSSGSPWRLQGGRDLPICAAVTVLNASSSQRPTWGPWRCRSFQGCRRSAEQRG